MAPVITREQAGLRAARSVSHVITPHGITDHYAGDPLGGYPWSHSRCASIWRAFQAYHMDKHGWVDIAYSAGVCIHGYIFVGRWWGARTAANGSDAGNLWSYAVCYMAGKGEPFTDAARAAFLDVHAMARHDGGAGDELWPHSHWYNTTCPDSEITAWITAGTPAPASVDVLHTAPVPHGKLNSPMSCMVRSVGGNGYIQFGEDGGVFVFGDAAYHGSLPEIGVKPNTPIVGGALSPSGGGYWLASSDGGVYAFGDAPFKGSLGGIHLNAPVTDFVPSATGAGYWLQGSDGGIFAFGDAPFVGSAA